MNKQNSKAIYPILFGFFVMGFADVVGIATNYVKVDFSLSDTLANLIPMMVFLWFALFSIPTGVMMGKVGGHRVGCYSPGDVAAFVLL